MKPLLALGSVVIISALLAATLRARLEERRSELGLVPEPAAELPEALRSSGAPPDAAVVGATLGVFRPLVLNLLWMRSNRLHEEGLFFESAALARGITTLQPRLPEVWSFLAERMAYDVAGVSPVEDRLRWILEAVSLLRDRGLRYNPGSPVICETLAVLFLHRIGEDFDDAHFFYKDVLARTFEPDGDDGSGRRAALLGEWKLDPVFLGRLAARYAGGEGAGELDLRTPYTHALYWAEVGRSAGGDGSRYALSRLRHYRSAALGQLARRGFVVRQPEGRHYAYLPDPRFVDGAKQVLDEELALHGKDDPHREEVERVIGVFAAWAAVHLALWDRRDEAEAWFRLLPEHREAGDLDSVLVRFTLPEDADRAAVLDFVSGLVRTSLHLLLVGDRKVEGASDGLGRLAGLIHGAWSSRHPETTRLPPLDEIRRSLARDLFERLSASDLMRDLAERLEESLPPGILAGGAPTPAELGIFGISRAVRLPPELEHLRLEAPHPFFRASAGQGE